MDYVGIDVGSKELVMVIRRNGKSQKARTFPNTPEGHVQIIKALSSKREVRICVEATGIYHFDLAVSLCRGKGLQVMVVNPKASKNFANALMTRLKNDSIDAEVLALYAEKMEFAPWQVPDNKVLELRAFSRKIAALVKLKTRTKNQLHALEASVSVPAIILEETQASIDYMESQIDRLKKHALALVKSDEKLNRCLDIIVSVKGIAETSAIQLLGELLILPKDMNNRQWVAFAGLDPRHFQSGKSISKKPRISKAGNAYLRQALYMPALSATRHDKYVNAYYNHLIENQGLKKMQALCAVMRKMLHAIHAMLKNEAYFDNTRFFNMVAD